MLIEEIEQALKRCKYAAPKVILACGHYDQRIPDSYVFKGVEWELAYLNPGEKFRVGWRHVGPKYQAYGANGPAFPHTKEIPAFVPYDRLRRSAPALA